MNIKDIADLAGVSRATVSRYLNNGYVSDEKKEKIKKIIEYTGYLPSASAKTLRSKKTNFIGVIIPKINSDSISRMVSGINQCLYESGYQLLLACTDNDEEKELGYLNLFKENHVDGIVLLGTIFTPNHMKALKNLSVPIVILSQYIQGYSCVYSDDYNATKNLTKKMSKTGKIFGYLGVTEKDVAVGLHRKKGFIDALTELEIPISEKAFQECSFNIQSGYVSAAKLMKINPDIDSILCATDGIAIGAMKYLKENNFRIPEDVQIAGLGDSTISAVSEPSLTTVHFYYEEAGNEAARNLLDMIENKDCPLKKELKLGFQIVNNHSLRTL